VPAIALTSTSSASGRTTDGNTRFLRLGRDDPTSPILPDASRALVRCSRVGGRDAGDLPLTLSGELSGRAELLPRLLAMGFLSLSERRAAAHPRLERNQIRSLRLDATAARAP